MSRALFVGSDRNQAMSENPYDSPESGEQRNIGRKSKPVGCMTVLVISLLGYFFYSLVTPRINPNRGDEIMVYVVIVFVCMLVTGAFNNMLRR